MVTINASDTVSAILTASNISGCSDTTMMTIYPAKSILPAIGTTDLSADIESTDPNGWTHYYYTNGTATKSDDVLLLSLKKNSNNIGNTGVGSFSVRNVATQNAGSNSGIQITNPLMSNNSDYYTMNRFWQVTPDTQPGSNVGVRFYFNTQDYNDVNGSFSGNKMIQDFIFYHLKDGNPDPSTNWSGATLPVISILNGVYPSDTTWTYVNLGNNQQYAEFEVNSFSGGSAGFTGNNGPLPVIVSFFTATARGDDALLNWQTVTEKGIVDYEIQRSLDGKNYKSIYIAKANHEIISNYHYADAEAGKIANSIYYRLKVNETNGTNQFSQNANVIFSEDNENVIVLYPNPAKDKITLTGIGTYTQLKITDIDGKLVMIRNINKDKEIIEINGLATGTYTILLTNSKESTTIKFIKND
jgi:hypothetical protein